MQRDFPTTLLAILIPDRNNRGTSAMNSSQEKLGGRHFTCGLVLGGVGWETLKHGCFIPDENCLCV